jgi:5-methylcytosine-specific restriction endonuclease McrA
MLHGLDRQADVVHHLTYERLGNELLIDLVSLCNGCHDQAHGKVRSADVSAFVSRLSLASAR